LRGLHDKKYAVLTDIVGLEDGNGDMDFKVAGSKDGITAMQMDVKTLNLTLPVLEAALAQAKSARLEILKVIASAIDKPRDGVSKYAPKIKIIRIPPDKIGELIGPGGKTIKKIIAETGAQVDVDDDGTVFISGVTKESLEAGISRVEGITKVPTAGEVYEGTVKEERRKEQKPQPRFFEKRPQRGHDKYPEHDRFRTSGGPHFPTSRFLDKNKKRF